MCVKMFGDSFGVFVFRVLIHLLSYPNYPLDCDTFLSFHFKVPAAEYLLELGRRENRG